MPIRTSRLILSVVLIGTLSSALSPASAQTSTTTATSLTPIALAPITSAQRDRMSRSLVTVQTVTLLRDRGVLDEAQRERVTTLERELAAALAARDAAMAGNATQAQARLEQARAAFDAEVTTLVAANQGLVREIQALRADTVVQASRLSDEEVRQRQRFADGDTRALDIMDALATQREAAIDLAAKQRRAESRRDMARNFAIAVGRGDAGRTSADALSRWDEAAALDPTDFATHIERARLAQTIGNLPRARAAAEDGVRAAGGDLERAVAQGEFGDIAVLQGDLPAAGAAYQECNELYQGLLAASPDDTQLSRNLASSLIRIGVVAVQRGDLVEASATYNESLVIFRRLLAGDTSSAQLQRDVSVSLNKIGSVAVLRGDLVAASAAYSEGLVIRRRLSAANPSSAQAQRDVSFSLEKVGDVTAVRGDLAGANAAHSESLMIRRQLSAADPSSAAAQRDVSVTLSKIGEVAVARGDLAGASLAYRESLVIDRRLSAADASSAQALRDLSLSLIHIGDVAVRRDDLVEAGAAYSESLVIARRLSAADPSSAQAQRDVGVVLIKLARIQGSTIRWAQVVAHWRAMKRAGVLAPSDEELLTAIEEKAAQEAHRALPASLSSPAPVASAPLTPTQNDRMRWSF